jgi:hypothetical protein
MAELAPSLDALRALHAPPAPESLTPYIAMVLAGFVLAALIVAAARMLMAQRQQIRRAAEAELARTRVLPPPERLAAQAKLLRRLARVGDVDASAREQGTAWLARLDQLFATSFFSQGEGRVFGAELYSPRVNPDIEALDGALAGLIARLKPKRSRA